MNATASILVVDDQPDWTVSVRLLLKAAGHRVLTAGDGVEALAVLGSQPVHMILSDIAMPHMDGYQLTSACGRTRAG